MPNKIYHNSTSKCGMLVLIALLVDLSGLHDYILQRWFAPWGRNARQPCAEVPGACTSAAASFVRRRWSVCTFFTWSCPSTSTPEPPAYALHHAPPACTSPPNRDPVWGRSSSSWSVSYSTSSPDGSTNICKFTDRGRLHSISPEPHQDTTVPVPLPNFWWWMSRADWSFSMPLSQMTS